MSGDRLLTADLFNDLLGVGAYPEPPDIVPMRLLGLGDKPTSHEEIKTAFVRQVKANHPDVNSNGRLTMDELVWARDVLLRKVPKPVSVTDRNCLAGETVGIRNEAVVAAHVTPVTSRVSDQWDTVNSRNARLLAHVDREFTRHRKWRQSAGRSDDELFTELAIENVLICRVCLKPLGDRVYLKRRGGGSNLRGCCSDCHDPAEWWDRELEAVECDCGIEIIPRYDPGLMREIGWSRGIAEGHRKCSPLCERVARNAAARETRASARGLAVCGGCGESFTPKRADARFCSGACRQDAYRQRKAGRL